MAKKKSKKKRNRNRLPRDPLAPLNYRQLQILMDRLLRPSRAEFNRQARTRAGLGRALTDVYRDVAPEVQAAYEKAAQFTQGAAQGFSEDLRGRVGESGGADVLFGTEGFIPGSALAREGAAFTSAAAQLPATAAGMTQQDVTTIRRSGAQEMAAKRQELLQLLLDRELQKRAMFLQEGALNLDRDRLAADTALGFAGLRARDSESGGGKSAKKSERREYFTKITDDALSFALRLPSRPDGSPQLAATEAYNRIWNAFGRDLRKRNYGANKIRQMLKAVLLSVGYNPSDLTFIGGPTQGSGGPPPNLPE